MAREIFPASPESPFPFKTGAGSSTGFELKCSFCGTVHNEGLGLNGSEFPEGESVDFIDFGRFTVAECCFGKLEEAVLQWAPDIIAWLELRAEAHRAEAKHNKEMASRGRQVMDDAFGGEVPF